MRYILYDSERHRKDVKASRYRLLAGRAGHPSNTLFSAATTGALKHQTGSWCSMGDFKEKIGAVLNRQTRPGKPGRPRGRI